MSRKSVVINNQFVQDAFGSYLKHRCKLKSGTVKSYLSDMRSITKYLNDNKLIECSIYDVDATKFNKLMKKIYRDTNFLRRDDIRHQVFTAAINHYVDFMNEVYGLAHK